MNYQEGERFTIQGDDGKGDAVVEVCSEDEADMHIDGIGPVKTVGPEILLREKELKETTHVKVAIEGTENNREARRKAASRARKKRPPTAPEAGKTNKWDRENRQTRCKPSKP